MNENFFKNKEKLFDLWAPNYDCLLTTIFYQAIHQRLLEFVHLPENALVLDLGCGTGKLLNRLAAKFPTLLGIGCDLSSEMLRQARRKNKHQTHLIFVRGNAESLPFAQAQFEAVFNTISFLHYPQPATVLSEISRVLRPGGCYYLADYGEHLFNHFPCSQANLKFYSPQQREQLGAAAGLTCLGHHYLLGGVILSIFEKKKS